MDQIYSWIKKQLSNPQVVFLSAALVVLFVIIVYAGDMLAPVIAGVVIAYLLEGVIKRPRRAETAAQHGGVAGFPGVHAVSGADRLWSAADPVYPADPGSSPRFPVCWAKDRLR